MATIRAAKSNLSPYFQCSRQLPQDLNLSLEAVGLLCYLLSKPDGWEVQFEDVEKRSEWGRDKRRRIFAEIEHAGYFERKRFRNAKTQQWEYDLDLHEQPLPSEKRTNLSFNLAETPCPENTSTGGPCPDEPSPETQAITSKERMRGRASSDSLKEIEILQIKDKDMSVQASPSPFCISDELSNNSALAAPIEGVSVEQTLAAAIAPGLTVTQQAELVFNYWKKVMNHPKVRQAKSDKRIMLIKARLKSGYTVQDLCMAIDGCQSSDYHQARGEHAGGTVYDKLSLILRNDEYVDDFIAKAERKKNAKPSIFAGVSSGATPVAPKVVDTDRPLPESVAGGQADGDSGSLVLDACAPRATPKPAYVVPSLAQIKERIFAKQQAAHPRRVMPNLGQAPTEDEIFDPWE